MSVWAELKRVVNDNFNYPLNKQRFYPVNFNTTAEWFEQSTTYTAPHTGVYIITCVGKGGDGNSTMGSYHEVSISSNSLGNFYRSSGGGGAVCKGYVILTAGQTVTITVDTTQSSFGNYISAGAGVNGSYQYNSAPPASAGGAVLIAGNISNHAGFPGTSGGIDLQNNALGGNAGIITPYSLNDGWSQGYLPLTNFTEFTGGKGGSNVEGSTRDGEPGKFGGGTGATVLYQQIEGARGGGGYGGGGNWTRAVSVSGRTSFHASFSYGGKGVVIVEHGVTIYG